jgi:hypothetical protein
VLDPVKNTVEALQVEPRRKEGYDATKDYYHTNEGDTGRWMASPHNPMMDDEGRVWMTAGMRAGTVENNPSWIKETIVTDSMKADEIEIAYQSMKSRGNGMHLGFTTREPERSVRSIPASRRTTSSSTGRDGSGPMRASSERST